MDTRIVKKAHALTMFRAEMKLKYPGFRYISVSGKEGLWNGWLNIKCGEQRITEKQRDSWKQVNPWAKRDRSKHLP